MEIEKPSLKELLLQRQTLQQQVSAARQREAEVVLADIVRKMHEYEISFAELMGRKRESSRTPLRPGIEICEAVRFGAVKDGRRTGSSTRIETASSCAPERQRFWRRGALRASSQTATLPPPAMHSQQHRLPQKFQRF
jgi:DNA-binding protein H-NS